MGHDIPPNCLNKEMGSFQVEQVLNEIHSKSKDSPDEVVWDKLHTAYMTLPRHRRRQLAKCPKRVKQIGRRLALSEFSGVHSLLVQSTVEQFDHLLDDLKDGILSGDLVPCIVSSGGMSVTDVRDVYLTMREMKGKEVPHHLAVGPKWDESRLSELNAWVQHNSVTPKPEDDAKRQGLKVITIRWVFTQKSDGRLKSRLVARGFQDNAAPANNDSPTAGRPAFRLALTMAAHFQWPLAIGDIPTAFMQADADKLTRNVHLRPPSRFGDKLPKELHCRPGEVWKCNKPIYGLNDAPYLWYKTICDRLCDQGLIRSKWDPCSILRYNKDGSLPGIAVVHVDDIVFTGDKVFYAICDALLCKCGVKDLKAVSSDNPVTYCGATIKKTPEGFSIDQDKYIDMIGPSEYSGRRLEVSLTQDDIGVCRSVLGQLAWVANQTRAGIAVFVSETVGRLADDPRLVYLKRPRTLYHI